MNGAWTVVAGLMAMFMGSVRSSSESDRVGEPEHLNHARGVQYWHSTRFGAADREEQGIGVHVMSSHRVGTFFLLLAVSPIVHARSAQKGIGERESKGIGANSSWYGGSSTHLWASSSCVLLTLRPYGPGASTRSERHSTSRLSSSTWSRSIRKADAVLPVFARADQRSDTLKRVARRGRCRLLYSSTTRGATHPPRASR